MIIKTKVETFPLHQIFTISRGSKTETTVVTVTLKDGDYVGRGECGPNPRYNESPKSVVEEIEVIAQDIHRGLDRCNLQNIYPPGAARNAVDCAFWDLESKRLKKPVWKIAGLKKPVPIETSYTLSVDNPSALTKAAILNSARPLLKIKLNGFGDSDRIRAVKKGAPNARIIVDANESWSSDSFFDLAVELASFGVEMIEQPLADGSDSILAELTHPLPICADESCSDKNSLKELVKKYDMVNIKLDKAGGLTESLETLALAKALGFKVMVGCMVGTSLAMAPACLVAQNANIVDLDGSMLLAEDRQHPLEISNSHIFPYSSALWG